MQKMQLRAAFFALKVALVTSLALPAPQETKAVTTDANLTDSSFGIQFANITLESNSNSVYLPPGLERVTIPIPNTSHLEAIITMNRNYRALASTEVYGPLRGALEEFKARPPKETFVEYDYNDPAPGINTHFFLNRDYSEGYTMTNKDAVMLLENCLLPWIGDRLTRRKRLWRFQLFISRPAAPSFIAEGGLGQRGAPPVPPPDMQIS